MAVQFGREVLDELLAPGISSFDRASIPELSKQSDQEDFWLANLFLTSVTSRQYTRQFQRAIVTLILRTKISLREFRLAREATLSCVDRFEVGRPSMKYYFLGVSHWETTVLNMAIALDLIWKVFKVERETGSDYELVRATANRVKHFAEDVAAGNAMQATIPLWLEEDGLRTSKSFLRYSSIEMMLSEMTSICDDLHLVQPRDGAKKPD